MFILVATLVVPLGKEFFRVVLIGWLRRRTGPWSVLASALIWTIMHLDPAYLPAYALIGVALGYIL